MSTSMSRSVFKIAASLSILAAVLAASAVQAATPRLRAYEVSGEYVMQDGRTLRIDVLSRGVVMVESSSQEYWTAVSPNLLVSPDGMRHISLQRDLDGVVDRIELRTTTTTAAVH